MNIICIHWKFAAITEIRRDELFGNGVGIVYLEPKVSRMIDKICANPEQFSSLKEKLVAQYA